MDARGEHCSPWPPADMRLDYLCKWIVRVGVKVMVDGAEFTCIAGGLHGANPAGTRSRLDYRSPDRIGIVGGGKGDVDAPTCLTDPSVNCPPRDHRTGCPR